MLQIFHIHFPLHICKIIQMSCALVMQVKSYCNDDNINFEHSCFIFIIVFTPDNGYSFFRGEVVWCEKTGLKLL